MRVRWGNTAIVDNIILLLLVQLLATGNQTWDWGTLKKEENDAGVWGPQWGPGAKPLVGVWGQCPQKLNFFFQYVITKNSILDSQRALCLDQTFIWLFSKLH